MGSVNWLLMLVTLGLTIEFGKSDNLASAYGGAVSATMLMTSALLFIAMREIWRWSLTVAGAVAGVFMVVDAGFFTANFAKVAQGGQFRLIARHQVEHRAADQRVGVIGDIPGQRTPSAPG